MQAVDSCYWPDGEPGRYPYHRGKHLIIMAKRFAFVDESDWNDGPVCVHAGWLASDPVWQKFEAAWSRILAKKGLAAEGFHATDFFNRKAFYMQRPNSTNPYKDWDESEATQFIGDLTGLIATNQANGKMFEIGGGVEVKPFREFTLGERRWLTGASWDYEKKRFVGLGLPKSAYHISLWCLISHAIDRTRKGNTVDFVVDRHDELGARSKRFYDETRAGPLLKAEDRNKLGLISYYTGFKPKPEGLQAADLYAYLWTSWYRFGNKMLLERQQALDILAGGKPKLGIYGAEQLEHVLASSPYRHEFRDVS
jgi:hypothetical protein